MQQQASQLQLHEGEASQFLLRGIQFSLMLDNNNERDGMGHSF
jgi:hypothetical protein